MLDVIFVAMFIIVVVMFASVYLVRAKRNVNLHRSIQLTLAVVLAVAIVLFEVDVRFFTNWRELAAPSPWYQSGWATACLWIHLVFAIPTPFVWGWTIFGALKNFATETNPGFGGYAAEHKKRGWISVWLMTATAVTGCTFYWMAFIA